MSATRVRPGSDDGNATTKLIGVAVGVMIVASTTALILVTRDDDDTTAGAAAPPAPASVADSGTASVAAPPASPSALPSTPAASSTVAPAKPDTKPAAKPTIRSSPVAKNSSVPSPNKPVTYTVKKGDNLTVIAAWFHQHGYGDLYDRNKAVIGDNPDLIFPGQKITISAGKMSVGG